MGCWGVKSYEIDEAAEALDAGFERVNPARYEELMDDRNPLSFEQVQAKLACPETLAAALDSLVEGHGADFDRWAEIARLAYVGVTVRHAELKIALPEDVRERAVAWLENEPIEWDEPTSRRLRVEKELKLLAAGRPAAD